MREPYRLLDLFSGIGGFSLGLERSGGFKTVAFCEIEPFCRRVLAKHWPEVPCYDDVRTLTAERLSSDGIGPIDAVCGGFPCQDISVAGKGVGLEGDRSGLWSEIRRLLVEIRPKVAIVENVAGLLAGPPEQPGGWFGRILGDLAEIGFDAEWHCIPAATVGAHHRRDRIWIIANPSEIRRDTWRSEQPLQGIGVDGQASLANTNVVETFGSAIARQKCNPWAVEPEVGRVVDGIPRKLVEPRLAALGNAVVPQIPELIGLAILASEAAA